jgi:hypothetical protein
MQTGHAPPGAGALVADRLDTALAAECEVFTRYLIDRQAPADVVSAYLRAHVVSAVGASGSPRALDHAVMRVARLGPRFARVTDAFAALFVRGGLLRRKLVLLVSILESRGDTAALIDLARPGSRVAWAVEVVARGVLSVIFLVAAAALVVPLASWYLVSAPPPPTIIPSRIE